MPPSALEILTRLNIQYPMLFKLTNPDQSRSMHCGVLEFVAGEGKVFLPYWMLQNLLTEEGAYINVTNVSLPIATFARFQPQSTAFLEISDPKAVLENALRQFACLTVDDIIAISYNETIYELKVLELKPSRAVTIIECDMSVDFAPPVGYEEPTYAKPDQKPKETEEDEVHIPEQDKHFVPFAGKGSRLDGKDKPNKALMGMEAPSTSAPRARGVPFYDYIPGELRFIRNQKKNDQNGEIKEEFKPFTGEGQKLKTSSKGRA
ncbi:Ubiquitin recognition factor in ER-associated degradation protein 1 [Cichlidogyrus casuarinus]|uniref:Ubiquitin recognition factor in ER-associated degradation protein 1 n=1 Tax=Cichlidogyrus casuarinus TaxID=1844966 RepID=A0ABD2Q7N7_9PLAT